VQGTDFPERAYAHGLPGGSQPLRGRLRLISAMAALS
jgi:hypothetical protein